MIKFEHPRVWAQFGEKISKDPNQLIIDLVDCTSTEQAILRLGHVMRGKDSVYLETGRSPDALIDVLGDWFSENIGLRSIVHILNWDNVPIEASALLVSNFYQALLRVVRGELKYFEEGDALANLTITLDETTFHIYSARTDIFGGLPL